jgi:leader peptidase (prepilin peptidase) / N-methyltransferase
VLAAAVAPLACAVAGAVVGGLLPLAAYRLSVPHGVPARSACGRCGRPFQVGLAGWLRPGSRCAGCAGRRGPVAVAMIGAAALAGSAAGGAVTSHPAGSQVEAGLLLAVLLLVALAGILLSAVDLAVLRLPDVVVLPTAVAVAALLALAAATTGDLAAAVRALAAAGLLGTAYALLAMLPGGRWASAT